MQGLFIVLYSKCNIGCIPKKYKYTFYFIRINDILQYNHIFDDEEMFYLGVWTFLLTMISRLMIYLETQNLQHL